LGNHLTIHDDDDDDDDADADADDALWPPLSRHLTVALLVSGG
jgi:hypothetical protein